jgi:protein-disulfide isomerase
MRLDPRAMLLAAALALTGCQKVDDATFNARVHAYLLQHPEVIREAALKLAANDRQAAESNAVETLAKRRTELEHDPRDFVANPGGKFTVVEFFDYRCGYCKSAAPEVVKIIQENPDVRFVFKEFPIFGTVSDTAAKLALTPAGKSQGLALYTVWMKDNALTDAALDRHLTSVGLDPAQVRKDALDPALDQQLRDTRALAAALKIEGTPAFVIGDTIVPGADMRALREAIAKARSQRG